MKIGDMVRNEFYSGLERYGIVVEEYDRFIGAVPMKKSTLRLGIFPTQIFH